MLRDLKEPLNYRVTKLSKYVKTQNSKAIKLIEQIYEKNLETCDY